MPNAGCAWGRENCRGARACSSVGRLELGAQQLVGSWEQAGNAGLVQAGAGRRGKRQAGES